MRAFFRVVLLLLLATTTPPAAWACSCAVTTPVQAAQKSGIAYVGEVIATGPDTVEVRVVDAILGVAAGSVYVLPVNVGSSAGCGIPYPFHVGDRWIFYQTGTYAVNLCGPDQPEDPTVVLALHAVFDACPTR